MLEVAFICSFSLASILFLLSFIKKDKTVKLEKEIEQLSMNYLQEMYQLKKKMRSLEEELLISSDQSAILRQSHSNAHKQLLTEILTLYKKGHSIQSIASITRLSIDEVKRLLNSVLDQRSGFIE
ncbi:hypothetical protein [Halalkalibacter krulwichiae]|uniref:Resolvase HTH domain-containing protein n=1 Tax=Halalkalibacter krulwichiae TaxID=199441 RepID=A0A1X9M7I7_9BACI|nr:hypothetical protein [Halalkalibacter krulwichiae]ARK29377.1 hypothetical protein BkAM31D_05665 [Halalkalibacter krulwichiae]